VTTRCVGVTWKIGSVGKNYFRYPSPGLKPDPSAAEAAERCSCGS